MIDMEENTPESDNISEEIYVNSGKIFGNASIAYNSVSEISYSVTSYAEIKDVRQELFVKSSIALGLIIYMLFVLFSLKRYVLSTYKLLTDYRFAKKQYESTTSINLMNPNSLILFTILVVAISFSMFYNVTEYQLIIVPALAFAGIIILQSALLKLSGWVSKNEEVMGEIVFNRKYYMSILGIIIFPLTVLILLYDTKIQRIALIISAILTILLLLFMVIRILKIFSEAGFSYFSRFLYLCTLEISPYLALFVVFENVI
ncbi:MAG: DUF4271 domain-containing protein [Prevotellaceae bacterium]|jgi:hypothetical protein|nr:DUF4271 domain-containing protein [Prevotellaceae bacterium]